MNIDWNSNFLWGILSLAGGGIFSFIFFILGKKTKKIVYEINSTQLISDKLSQIKGLHITFDDKELSNLTSTTISIINKGNDIIEDTDFASLEPLQLKCSKEILKVSDANSFITKISNKTCNIKLKQINPNIIQIYCEFLKKNDEFILTILHTGEIELLGTLKSGKLINSNIRIYNNKLLFDNIFRFTALIFSVFTLAFYKLSILPTILLIYIMAITLIDYAKKSN